MVLACCCGWPTKAAIALTSTERWILIGLACAFGVDHAVVAVKVYKSPIFKIKAEAATTTDPQLNVGAG